MKQVLFLALALAGLATSCQKNTTTDAKLNKVESNSNLASGVIPTDVKMHDFVFNPQKYSWETVNNYYKQEVLVNHQKDSYYNNLRKTTIAILVNQFDFLEKASLTDIEFYANELKLIDLPDPEVTVKVLSKLNGQWTPSQVAMASQNIYDRNMKFIQEKLNAPQDYMEKFGAKWEPLKKLASGMN